MGKPTKSLLVGILAATAGVIVGRVQAVRFEHQVELLQKTCVADGERIAKETGPPSFRLTCDPVELATSSGTLVGVQQDIATAQRQAWAWKQWPVRVSAGVGGLLAVPWIWYFLLRRIRELREAIVGR